MNYHWKQFPVCRDCGRYRSHDNHMPFETCNRENNPCRFPKKHHQFAPKPVAAEEPRLTIVREMAHVWRKRNLWNAYAQSSVDQTATNILDPDENVYVMLHFLSSAWQSSEALHAIRRIWHAVRDRDYL